MRLTLLGTSDARQVPVYNCNCPACDAARVYPSRRRGPYAVLTHIGHSFDDWLLDRRPM